MKHLALIWLDLRNLFFAANKVMVWLVFGADPRMTFSAIVHLRGWSWLEAAIDWLYELAAGQTGHCEEAASGWENFAHDRSVALPHYLVLRIALCLAFYFLVLR